MIHCFEQPIEGSEKQEDRMTIDEIITQLRKEFPAVEIALVHGMPHISSLQAITEEEQQVLEQKIAQRLQELSLHMSDQDIASAKFSTLAAIGKTLMDLHLHYEDAPEYPLTWHWSEPRSWRVERMRFNRDKTTIIVNPSLFLSGIPPEAHEYKLGNRSALEWILDQYQVTEDRHTGIVSDPNREDDPEYIARLVCKVCFVSVETVKLQALMGEITGPEDWIGVDGLESAFEQSAKAGPEMPDGSLWSE